VDRGDAGGDEHDAGEKLGAIVVYERALVPRNADAAVEAGRDFARCYGDDAPHSLVRLLTGQAQPP
jgi:hypothetical protein